MEYRISRLCKAKCHSRPFGLFASCGRACRTGEKSQPVCVVASQKAAKKLTSVKNIPVLDIQNQLDRLDGSGENILRQGEVGDPDIAVIIFSSGTTRTASGIMHTHDSQINSCKMVCRCNGITDNERYLGILPNSHIYGLFAQVLAPLLTGGTVCFIESLSAKGLSAGFQNFKPTVFPGVPKVYELLKTQIMQQINASKVSSALFKKMFPVALHQRKIYGINSGKKSLQRYTKPWAVSLDFSAPQARQCQRIHLISSTAQALIL